MTDEPLLLTGTGRLLMAQVHAAEPPATLSPWAVVVRHGRVAWVGSPDAAPATDRWEDLGSALVTPGLVDAHTHPVFAGDRSDEAAARLAGQPYEAGGILRTVASTRAASDDTLEALVEEFAAALDTGTTTLEAKSGYGLTLADELRSLRIIRAAAERVGIRAVRTFLGAHAVPPEAASADDHVEEIVQNMLPAVAGEAEFADVFCDRGFFTVEQAERVWRSAGARDGVQTPCRAAGPNRRDGARRAARCVSVDHLEQLDAEGERAGRLEHGRDTPPRTGAAAPRPPAAGRALLDAGATVALATDANAGTYANPSMPLVIGLGAAALGMTVDEAVAAATSGGAAAIGLSTEVGVIREGMAADLVAWDAEHEGPSPCAWATSVPSGSGSEARSADMDRFDFVVIGAGAAGEAAAANMARRRGASVAIVDRDLIGGSCSFWACIPSKSLLHSAAVHAGGGDYPWPKAAARRDYNINRIGIPYPDDAFHVQRLEDVGAVIVRGTARLDGPGRVVVTHDDVTHELRAPMSWWPSAPSHASRTCRDWTRSRTGRTARAHRPASCRRACSSSAAGRPASSWPRSTPATGCRSPSSSRTLGSGPRPSAELRDPHRCAREGRRYRRTGVRAVRSIPPAEPTASTRWS